MSRRLKTLSLPHAAAYREYLFQHPEEWNELRRLCRITISRFARDRRVFEVLGRDVLPRAAELSIARGDRSVRCWCAGCGAGEEVYTLAILWRLDVAPRFGDVTFEVVGTDVDSHQIARARMARYPEGALRELAAEVRRKALEPDQGAWRVRAAFRENVRLEERDLVDGTEQGPFDMILCRNLAFTYFEPELQEEIAMRLVHELRDGGVLVLGKHETLPVEISGLTELGPGASIYRCTRRARAMQAP